MDPKQITMTIEQAIRELNDNILGFWLKFGLDSQTGGFVGRMHNDLTIEVDAPQGLILNSRLLWTFAAAYRTTQKEQYLEAAHRAYHHLGQYFHDKKHNGYYWMLDSEGKPIDTKKKIYGQAFMIYALSEYYRVKQDENILEQAKNLYELIEHHSLDREYGGYFEAYEQNWEMAEDLRLSEIDMNEKKSMNTHLHILEAYTNLYRVWSVEPLKISIKQLLQLFTAHIIDSETKHFKLFFDETWQSKTNRISYGHDIEGSWLLFEAAEVIQDQTWVEKIAKISVEMAEAVLKEGIEPDGAIIYESDPGVHVDKDKHWWPQAESVVGFLNAFQLVTLDKYLAASLNAWQFIQTYIADHNKGEWFWRVDKDGTPYQEDWKISEWKGPYHNARACMELIQRLELIVNK